MKKSGNSEPSLCLKNLLSLEEGEVPLDRLRGLPAGLIDQPTGRAVPKLREAVRQVATTYEPRLSPGEIDWKGVR